MSSALILMVARPEAGMNVQQGRDSTFFRWFHLLRRNDSLHYLFVKEFGGKARRMAVRMLQAGPA